MIIETIIDLINSRFGTAIGIISSIASLIVSFFVFLGVKKLKKYYLFKARSPVLASKLSEVASSLSDQLNYFSGMTIELSKSLSKAEAHLESLEKKVDSDLKRSIKSVLCKIRSVNHANNSFLNKFKSILNPNQKDRDEELKNNIHNIYIELYKLNVRVKNLLEDHRWK